MDKKQTVVRYNFIDLTGKKFGRITAISFIGKMNGKKNQWKCICDCGTEKVVDGYNLRSGQTKSCGCYAKEAKGAETHGLSSHPLYAVHQSMKARCYNPNNEAYHNYGGRGIKVCNRWLRFENFYSDMIEGWMP